MTARLEDRIGADEGWDVVLAGDVSYERDMAEAVTGWLVSLVRRGAAGDPRRTYLAFDRSTLIAYKGGKEVDRMSWGVTPASLMC